MNLMIVHRERIRETKRKSKSKKLCRPVTCTLAGACAHEVRISSSLRLNTNNQQSPVSEDFIAKHSNIRLADSFSHFKIKEKSSLAMQD